jgi:hypothetical protein
MEKSKNLAYSFFEKSKSAIFDYTLYTQEMNSNESQPSLDHALLEKQMSEVQQLRQLRTIFGSLFQAIKMDEEQFGEISRSLDMEQKTQLESMLQLIFSLREIFHSLPQIVKEELELTLSILEGQGKTGGFKTENEKTNETKSTKPEGVLETKWKRGGSLWSKITWNEMSERFFNGFLHNMEEQVPQKEWAAAREKAEEIFHLVVDELTAEKELNKEFLPEKS